MDHKPDVVALTADVVSAYVANNSLPAGEIGKLITDTHSAFAGALDGKPAEAERPDPAVPIRKSVTDDFIICLEDGKKFKSLKRHIRTHYNLTPEQYRARWNLPADYPMVAPAYARERSQLAKKMGLGQRRRPAAA